MIDFKIGERCWTYLTNLTGNCTLDAFSLKTFWIEEWEIMNIREGALKNQDLKILLLKNIREWINPREVISDCCYKSRESAISDMRKKLKDIESMP